MGEWRHICKAKGKNSLQEKTIIFEWSHPKQVQGSLAQPYMMLCRDMRLSWGLSFGETGALRVSLGCAGRAKGDGSCLEFGLVVLGEGRGTLPGSARLAKEGSGRCSGKGAE